ncbi:MAG: hypothetical protein A3D64_02555 [Candidatus Wildermuthbacteria bacterium RIFCSPHIGHO2_02_FULL_49_9]|uniref:DUF1614 domain-containing protein n=2 Tax=Candidatus Wildermuthiibacteriota TaxID=1817923 RepID=A0A1G2QX10_9BACT|nr:MAG: hypothetical protein A2672_03130 [Candidatus Wildermuthbacteria bacterium RIFCSPHIGHO2_01_FULL_49_22b]OHA71373.1 MAG: hypothetical protein A3D64_02555 [Candidatus Wildermuthbacteria bacterium RIFCSPHIGHO2_02_FULL_49_9]
MLAPFLLIILGILAVPALLFFGFWKVLRTGFENLGFAPETVVIVLVLMVLGSFVSIPLSKRKLVEVTESHFFGLFSRKRLTVQGLSLNVGGGAIPLAIAGFLLFRVPLQETLIAILLMTLIVWKLSRIIPNRGVAVPVFLPPLFAVLFAVVLAPQEPALVAFVAGTLGVLIGADLLRLPQVMKGGVGMLSIGGAGVFDGIFLVGIVAALLAGL